jgi:hypothetical protein
MKGGASRMTMQKVEEYKQHSQKRIAQHYGALIVGAAALREKANIIEGKSGVETLLPRSNNEQLKTETAYDFRKDAERLESMALGLRTSGLEFDFDVLDVETLEGDDPFMNDEARRRRDE